MTFNFLTTDLATLRKQLISGDTTATQLAAESLANIAATDDALGAFVHTESAEAAVAATEATADSPLAGVPFGLKDNIATDGIVTTSASKMLAGFKPVYDATVVRKLKAAGAVMVGKTNMDEFAMGGSTETSYHKVTKNAWDQTKVPGGSSGGSAAAVAAGQVPFTLGSDTGGSIRQPAAFNGIVGMKPTYGRVSRWGLFAMSSSLDQIGPFTKTVRDNALVLNAISGHDAHDSTSADVPVPDFAAQLTGDITGLRIAVPAEYFGDGIDAKVAETVQSAIKQLEARGAIVDSVNLPHTKYGVAAYYIIMASEASSNLQRYDGVRYGFRAEDATSLEDLYVKTRSQGFGDEVKRRIMLGTFSLSAGSYDAFFNKAAKIRTLIRQDFDNVFADYDVIVGPTAPSVAYGIGDEVDDPKAMYLADALTVPVNLAGLPGLSVNAGFVDGLPVGLQVIGKAFDEATVYRVGYAVEQAVADNAQPAITSKY